MATLKILVDMADCYREGLVDRVEPMPNVDGRFIIYVKPIGVKGLFSTYEISNIPRNGWKERQRPDGNIAFILLMNESGEAPFLRELGLMTAEAVKTVDEQNKIMEIRKKVETANQQIFSQDALNIVKKHKAILEELEKKSNKDRDPRFNIGNRGL